MTMLGSPALPTRFWIKVSAVDSGCWQWTAATDSGGYGKFKIGGVSERAHRFAYEVLVGPIPDGLELDHLCRNRACCNPEHLEAVTSGENTRRGESFAALHARKTECPQGHPYDTANTYRGPDKGRYCRACNAEAAARYRARKSA